MLVTSRERLGRRIGVAVSPYRMPTLHNDGSAHQHWGSEE